MIDNTILAGGAAQAPEITVDAAGLITATAGDKTSTLQQQTGAFSYSPAGDAFYTSPGAYLAAQGFMPNLPAVVVDRKIGAIDITFGRHTFQTPNGEAQYNCVMIPLTYSVLGGDNRNIVSYSVALFGYDTLNNYEVEALTGPFSVYGGLSVRATQANNMYIDVVGQTLYVATTTQSMPDVPQVSYCVVYRNR